MVKEQISVILVNYNGKAYNDKCIESILNSTVKDKLQVVVVDNASTDNSLMELRTRWGQNKQVLIIELDQNYGFSKANNEGIRWSLEQGIDRFLLLNNDTEIEPDTIEKMLNAQKKTGGMVVPKVLYADKADTIWCAGGEFSPIIKKPRQRGLNQIDKGQFDESGECGFANGCCLLISSEIVDKIGLLDERFFLFHEDTEYSLRAQEKNVSIWYCADAVVYHKASGSTKGNEKPVNHYYVTRNWLLCNRIHLKGRFFLFVLYFLCNRLTWAVLWCVGGKFAMVSEMLRGWKDFFKKKYGRAC